jgi:hypothetical protein
MRKILCYTALVLMMGCGFGKKKPNISAVDVPLTTIRYEQLFFSIDTLRLDAALQKLSTKEPFFTQDFLYNILATTPETAAKEVPLL